MQLVKSFNIIKIPNSKGVLFCKKSIIKNSSLIKLNQIKKEKKCYVHLELLNYSISCNYKIMLLIISVPKEKTSLIWFSFFYLNLIVHLIYIFEHLNIEKK